MSKTHIIQTAGQEYLTIARDLLDIKVWPIDMWKKALLNDGVTDTPPTAIAVVEIIRAGKRQLPQFVTDNHVVALTGLCISLGET